MSDLVELLNDLNQGNRIEYSDYSQLMFCIEQLEKENARLSKMLELAFGDLCSECNCPYWNNVNWEEYRAELEKRVEEHKNDNNCPDVMCDDCNKECELKKIMGETK